MVDSTCEEGDQERVFSEFQGLSYEATEKPSWAHSVADSGCWVGNRRRYNMDPHKILPKKVVVTKTLHYQHKTEMKKTRRCTVFLSLSRPSKSLQCSVSGRIAHQHLSNSDKLRLVPSFFSGLWPIELSSWRTNSCPSQAGSWKLLRTSQEDKVGTWWGQLGKLPSIWLPVLS